MTPAESFRLTGRHVLFALLAFFGVVSAVNGAFLYFALATHPGIDTEDSYRRGVAYNTELDAAAGQRARGWRARIDHDADGRALRLSLADRTGRPLDGLDVTAEFRRPAHSGDDRRIRLTAEAPGRYRGALNGLGAGLWTVRVTARDGAGRAFRLDQRIQVE